MGGFIGILSGFLGLGGGILIVPLLPLITQLPQQQVIGTSLFCIFLVVFNNTWKFHKMNLVSWPVVLRMGPITGVLAFIFGRLSFSFTDTQLKALLATVLFVVMIWTLLKKTPKVLEGKVESGSMDRSIWWVLAAVSALAGLLSGLTGVGSGMILGAILINLQVVSNEKLSPTSNGIMMFTTGMGVPAFLMETTAHSHSMMVGSVHLDLAIGIVLGAMTTSQWSRRYQHRLQANPRKFVLGGLLFVLFVKTVFHMV